MARCEFFPGIGFSHSPGRLDFVVFKVELWHAMYCIPISRGPSYFGGIPVIITRTYGIRRYYGEYYPGNILRGYLVTVRDQTRDHAVMCVASYYLSTKSIPAGIEAVAHVC